MNFPAHQTTQRRIDLPMALQGQFACKRLTHNQRLKMSTITFHLHGSAVDALFDQVLDLIDVHRIPRLIQKQAEMKCCTRMDTAPVTRHYTAMMIKSVDRQARAVQMTVIRYRLRVLLRSSYISIRSG